jgi:hypothetical protein
LRKRLVGIVGLCLLAGSLVRAQSGGADKPPMYTYVSEWAVPRAMWGDYQKLQTGDDEALGKRVADGTLIAFGSYSVLNHQEGLPTHGSWFSASSMANLMKALEELRSAPDNTSPVLAASRHWDLILMSRDYHAHSGTFKNGYLRVGTWKYKAGVNDPGGKIVKATMVAMFERLLNEGALHGYQIDVETVHSSDPDAFNLAIIANGAEGIDKFDVAIDDMEKNNPAGEAAFESLLDTHGHRDFLAHVDMMSHR